MERRRKAPRFIIQKGGRAFITGQAQLILRFGAEKNGASVEERALSGGGKKKNAAAREKLYSARRSGDVSCMCTNLRWI